MGFCFFIICTAKYFFFRHLQARFLCSAFLGSLIAPFIISGAWSYPFFVFYDEILHSTRLKLAICIYELAYSCRRSFRIVINHFYIFAEVKLLIDSDLVIKQFVIDSSKLSFFFCASIFPNVYFSLQFFDTILCLKYQLPQTLTELAMGLCYRNFLNLATFVLILKCRTVHQVLSHTFSRYSLGCEHLFIRFWLSWRMVKLILIQLIKFLNFLKLRAGSIAERYCELKIINRWLLLLFQILVLGGWSRLMMTEIKRMWSSNKLFSVNFEIDYWTMMRMCISILMFDISFFKNIWSSYWQALLWNYRLLKSPFLTLQQTILLLKMILRCKISVSLNEWWCIFLTIILLI